MSETTASGTPSMLKQVMLAINIGFDKNDKVKVELIYPHGFEKEQPEMWEAMRNHANAWYNDLLEYSNKVINGEGEE